MDLNLNGVFISVFLIILIVVSITDIQSKIIPDRIIYPSLALGLLWRLFHHPLPLWNYLTALVIGGGFFYLLAFISLALLKKQGMGGGDIKLMAFVGLCLGIKLTLLTIFLAGMIGWVAGIMLLITRRIQKSDLIPFGPFISLSAAVSALWGERILQGYANILMNL